MGEFYQFMSTSIHSMLADPAKYLLSVSYLVVSLFASYFLFVWLFSLLASKTMRASNRLILRFVTQFKPIAFLLDITSTVVGGLFTAIGGALSATADLTSSILLAGMNSISVPLGFLNGKLNRLVSVLQEGAHKQKMRSLELRLQRQIDRNRRREEVAKIQREISDELNIANGGSDKDGNTTNVLH